jgi:hypothetical protein
VPDEPVAIIEMPEYRRGVAIAYCDSSGPLEAQPETFYAISPTPKDWPAPRVESFYREYNQSMLANLGVHRRFPHPVVPLQTFVNLPRHPLQEYVEHGLRDLALRTHRIENRLWLDPPPRPLRRVRSTRRKPPWAGQ